MTRAQLAAHLVQARTSELEASLRIIRFMQRFEHRTEVPTKEIIDFFGDHAISHPNYSRLRAKLRADRRVLYNPRTNAFRLRAAAACQLDEEMGVLGEERPTTPFVATLEAHLSRLTGEQTRKFVHEAVQCVRNETPRAAIIMAWCGAISVMQEYVFKNLLADFNADATRTGLLKAPAASLADMRDISKESQFLECLARISVIDDATKRALKRCLDRRNDVSHPSEVRLSEAAVADHIESLILNVFERFGSA